MRTGSYSMQQGLTQEAANIVKQAVTLAKRRGHAQVTPLHVASTMLSVTNGLFRNACLQSHSHPLRSRALELCFNVSLNRLPASTSSPMLGPHHHHHSQYPQISNALVAAFKRAQAHQRRGSVESQQQPLLAVKIELEQLIISILDDPSVSRVMKEAGFSSPQVKSNVEQAVSLEICNNSPNSLSGSNKPSKENKSLTSSLESKKGGPVHQTPTWWDTGRADVSSSCSLTIASRDLVIRDEDVSSVMETLVSQRRRSIVIVGECVSTLEGVIKGVMDKVEKLGDDDVGESNTLRGVKFVNLSLSSLVNVSRVEVEKKVEDLRSLMGKGCVLYVGDLKWVIDYYHHQGMVIRANCYCPVDHMVMEIAKLVNKYNNNYGRFWMMGIATFQGYMRCKNGQPSLESLWGLHPFTIPSGRLSLSLITTDSGIQNQSINTKDENRPSWLLLERGGVRGETKSHSSSSGLPAWLQQYKNESKGVTTNDEDCVPMGELCKKWNSMCSSSSSIQKQPYHYEKTLTLSPSSSTSGFSYEHQNPNIRHNKSHYEPTLQLYTPESNYKGTKKNPFSSSNPISSTSNPNSTSSSDVIMEMEHMNKFKELNPENLKTLCNALERKVPWQKGIIPEIISTLLQCRSGMLKRKGKVRDNDDPKEETWLFFQGADVEAKEKMARELGRVVFGSRDNFVSMSMSNFASTRADSTEDCCRKKRSREEPSCSYIDRFAGAVSCNPHRVFFVEDIEQADYCSQLGFKRAIENGRVEDLNGEEFGLCDAIIILSCESFSSRSRACSPKQKSCEGNYYSKEENNKDDDTNLEETISPCVSLDLDLNISIDDDDFGDEDRSVDEIGLLESVDRRVTFKIQEL